MAMLPEIEFAAAWTVLNSVGPFTYCVEPMDNFKTNGLKKFTIKKMSTHSSEELIKKENSGYLP